MGPHRSRGAEVVILLRGGEDRAKGAERAAEFVALGAKVGYLSRLHAKIYISEHEVIVTSMNLYDSSALDSWEVAIRFTKLADNEAYTKVLAQAQGLGKKAIEEAAVAKMEKSAKAAANPLPGTLAAIVKGVAQKGHCIRCGGGIKFDKDHPYCGECYKSWAKYKNPDYAEKHCHSCGKEKATSMAKPLCKPCWDATT